MNATSPNIPPADELSRVRAAIKDLQAREGLLKTMMLTYPSARTGNSFVAEVKDVAATRVDIKELRSMYPAAVAEYTFATTEQRVVLKHTLPTMARSSAGIPRKTDCREEVTS